MTHIDILEEQAVNAAIKSNWDQAISLNKQIIDAGAANVGTYLRLGFASLQSNKIAEAKQWYKKALELQPQNNIALDHLEKIEVLESRGKGKSTTNTANLDPNLFLELPGKTKTVKLVNLGQKEDLATLNIGQELEVKEKKRRLEVRTMDGDYLGCLPDDVSRRIMHFINEKSVYKAFIKETSLNEVTIFLREVSKGPKVMQLASFPSNPQTYLNDIHKEDSEDGENDHEHDDEDGDSESSDWPGMEDDDHHEDKEDVDSVIQIEDEEEEEFEE